MSVDIRRIEQQISRVQGSGSAHEQQSMISSLVTSIDGYVDTILEEDELSRSVRSIEQEIQKIGQDPDRARELSEMEGLLNKAKNAKNAIGQKRSALRSLESSLQEVMRKIRRIT